MLSVARLSIAPVKSMGLQHPGRISLETWGVPENRRFYLSDPDGRLISGGKNGSLMRIKAAYEASRQRLSLRMPDGTVVEGDTSSLGDPIVTGFYSRPVRGHVVQGPWAAAISSYLGRQVLLVTPDTPGDANDEAPVTMVSTASVEELGRRAGGDTPDARRFRMLVEIAGCRPHEEDTWRGRQLRIGDAVVAVGGPVPRCVVTTLGPDTGVKDFDTLRTIAAYRGVTPDRDINFGVYGEVQEPGTISVGDPIELVREEVTAQ